MSNSPYVLFINPLWQGHIPSYMRLYWPPFLERGWRIHNLVDHPEEAARFSSAQFGDEATRISHSGFPASPGADSLPEIQRLENRWETLGNAVKSIRQREGEPALVFHAWADLWTNAFLPSQCVRRALPLPWAGICLHPVELRVRKSWKRRLWELVPNLWRYGLPTENRLRALSVPHFQHVILLDENVLPQARRFFPNARKIHVFPDAANTAIDKSFRVERLEELRAEGRPIIAVIGVLQRRKGFLRLMEAARAAPGNWGFLFAGEIAWDDLNARERESCRRFIDHPPANTALHLKFMEDVQVNSLVSHSDLLYLAYEGFFHSSHIQIKAAHYRKPCLTGPRHLLAERTRRFDLGWTLQDFSPATLIDFLARTDRAALEEKLRTGHFEEFSRLHSIQRLHEALAELIESALPPAGSKASP
jgi:glycosyltransferase involved in cell wall biosynthesis